MGDWIENKIQQVRENPNKHPDYQLREGALFKKFAAHPFADKSQEWKLCVPVKDRTNILKQNHDAVTAGHLGVSKTAARIMDRYHWPGMFRDIANYVKRCRTCNEYKVSQQKPSGLMYTNIASSPWDTVCADFVGPLPKSMKGNTMMLVIVDKFTKWVTAVPMRAASTTALIKAVRERVFFNFGIPRVFLSDNGAQFTSNQFKTFLEELGVKQMFTAPYTPQENPTERVNRVIKTMMAQYVQGNHRTWDEFLPELTFAINTSKHSSTGFTPAYLNFGKELKRPKEPNTPLLQMNATVEDISLRQERLQALYQLVKENLENAANTQGKYYNLRRRAWRPCIGEYVYKRKKVLSSAVNQFTEKLAPKYEGPYVVIKLESPVITVLKKVGPERNKGPIVRAHVRDLKGYKKTEDAEETNPSISTVKSMPPQTHTNNSRSKIRRTTRNM